MQPHPREIIQARLKALNMTQIQLATQLKIATPVLSRALYDPIIPTGSHWPAILDILGLEVVIQPKSNP